ncbi:MAG: methyltransferase domain-containing protein [Acidimicrobiia bacterium]
MPESRYIIRGGLEGRERLRTLSRVLRPTTRPFLDRAGVRVGARCLDAGCGGGDVTIELAAIVGAGGSVLGIDIDDLKLEIAREEAREADVKNVTYECLSIDDISGANLDAVYARFLLSHLPDPEGTLDRMRTLTRVGGVVAVEDVDFTGSYCYPENAAFARYCDLYTQAAHARGADPNIGRRLPQMFVDAGLAEIDVSVVQPTGFDPEVKRVTVLTLENIADAVVDVGLATRPEVNELVGQLAAFAAEPTSVLSFPRIVQVAGTV